MSQLLKKIEANDALMQGYKARKMFEFLEKKFPTVYKDLLKAVDITPYEIKTLTYTHSQYKKFENYCKKQGYSQYTN